MVNQEIRQSPGTKPGFFYGYIVVVAAFFIMVLTWGVFNTYGVFFKPLSTEFGWTRALTSGAYSLGYIMAGLIGIGVGILTDRYGPRLVMTICGFLLGSGYLLMSQVNTIWHLYLFYGVILGFGMSGSDVSLLSTVARWFIKKRGMMSGIIKVGTGTGMSVMPLLINWLITDYGWRTSYIVIGFITLAFITSAAQFLKRDPSQMGLLPDRGEVREETLDFEATGFSFQEAIHTRQFVILCAIYLLAFFCTNAIMVHTYPHVVDFGISGTAAATILSAIGGASIAGRFIMGSAGDRIGNKLALIISLVILSVALLWLELAREAWMFYVFAAIYGFAHGAIFALISPMVAELFGLSSHGIILGTVMFSGTIGGAIGPVMVGYIFDITNSYQPGFLILLIASIVALTLINIIKTTRPRY